MDIREVLERAAPTGGPVDVDAIRARVETRRHRQFWARLAAATAAAATMVAVGVAFLTGGPLSNEPKKVIVHPAGPSPATTTPRSTAVPGGRLTTPERLMTGPGPLRVDLTPTSLYVAGWAPGRDRLERLDPATGNLDASVVMPGPVLAVQASSKLVWLAVQEGALPLHPFTVLFAVNPRTLETVHAVTIPAVPDNGTTTALAAAGGWMWLETQGALFRVDTATGTAQHVSDLVPPGSDGSADIAANAAGTVLVAAAQTDVERLSPTTGAVEDRYGQQQGYVQFAGVADGQIWMSFGYANGISYEHIDLATGRVDQLDYGGTQAGLLVSGDRLLAWAPDKLASYDFCGSTSTGAAIALLPASASPRDGGTPVGFSDGVLFYLGRLLPGAEPNGYVQSLYRTSFACNRSAPVSRRISPLSVPVLTGCPASSIRARAVGVAALQHVTDFAVLLTNTGSFSCTLRGRPSVTLTVPGQRTKIPSFVDPGTQTLLDEIEPDAFRRVSPSDPIVVPPEHDALFYFAYSSSDGSTCPAQTAHVAFHLRDLRLAPADGLHGGFCSPQQLDVSPIGPALHPLYGPDFQPEATSPR